MRKKIKALLFSALIFPGTGQLILKRYKSAALFICASLIAIVFIALDVLQKAFAITDRIIAGEIQPEYSVIRGLIEEQQANSDSQLLTIIIYSLIAIWLLSIIDIVRLKNNTFN